MRGSALLIGNSTTTRFGRTQRSDIEHRGSSPKSLKLPNPHGYQLRKTPPQVIFYALATSRRCVSRRVLKEIR